MARRYTFAALSSKYVKETTTVVEADYYELGEGHVTFIRDNRKILSVPYSKTTLIGELDDEGELPIRPHIS